MSKKRPEVPRMSLSAPNKKIAEALSALLRSEVPAAVFDDPKLAKLLEVHPALIGDEHLHPQVEMRLQQNGQKLAGILSKLTDISKHTRTYEASPVVRSYTSRPRTESQKAEDVSPPGIDFGRHVDSAEPEPLPVVQSHGSLAHVARFSAGFTELKNDGFFHYVAQPDSAPMELGPGSMSTFIAYGTEYLPPDPHEYETTEDVLRAYSNQLLIVQKRSRH